MLYFRDCWEAYVAASSAPSSRSAWWKKCLGRSVFSQSVLRSLVALAAAGNWTITLELRARAELICGGFTQTKLVEDAFQRERHHESHHTVNKKMSNPEKWATCIREGVLNKVHGFTEVPWKDHPASAADPTSLPDGVYIPKNKLASCPELKSIVSRSAPTWHSVAPVSFVLHAVELQLLRQCHAEQSWSTAPQTWKGILCKSGLVIKSRTSGKWALSMGHFSGGGVPTWPVEQIYGQDGVGTVLRLRTDAKAEDIAIEFVRSFADWLVWPAGFASPMDLDALGCPTDMCCQVALITAAAPEPLPVIPRNL